MTSRHVAVVVWVACLLAGGSAIAAEPPMDAMADMPMDAQDDTPAAGDAPAPPPPTDHFADRYFPSDQMAQARAHMMHEQGAQLLHRVFLNVFEYQTAARGADYRWDGEAWFGRDINRFVLKSEGEGRAPGGADTAEVQALYSRSISPFFNLQAGLRFDFAPPPHHVYATIGIEGLAPYMVQTEAALFVSEDGKVLGRLEGWYDQRVTQRLVFQPRAELNLAAQDVRENGIGAGLVNAELGARVRYEIWRELAPYVGFTYSAKTGHTARFARDDGKDQTKTAFVAGLRFWF